MKEFKQTVVKALLPQIILTQATSGKMHGYALIKHVRKHFNVYLGASTVYPALNDMERQGFIQSQWTSPQGNDRPRKIYSLTNKGKLLLGQTTTVLAFVNKMIEVNAT